MEENTKSNKSILSDALLVSLLSAVGYLTAYCYESGYCEYFHIPSDFIDINISKIITVTLSMFGAILTIGHFASPFWDLASSKSYAKRLIGKYIFLLMFICIAAWSTDNLKGMAWAFLVPIFEFYVDLIHPLFSKKSISGYVQKIEANQKDYSAEKERSIWFYDRVGRALSRQALLLVAGVLTAMLVASGLGRSLAKNQVFYLCAGGSNRIVVLRQYGNSLIGVTLDTNNVVKDGIYVIDRSNLKDYSPLSLQRIGAIKPNSSMTQAVK